MGAHIFLHPCQQAGDAGIGQVASGIRQGGHLFKELEFAVEKCLGVRLYGRAGGLFGGGDDL